MKYLLISFIFLVGCPGKNATVNSNNAPGTIEDAKDPALGAGASGASIIPATPASTTGTTGTPLTPVITNPATSFTPAEAGYTVTKSGIAIYVPTSDLGNVNNIKVPKDKKFLEVRINLDKEAFKKALNAQRVVDDEGKKIDKTSAAKPTAVTMKLPTSYVNISTKRQTDQLNNTNTQVIEPDTNGDIVGVETVDATVAYGQGCCPVVQISCGTLKGKTTECALAKNASLNALAIAAITSHANFYRATTRAEDIAAQYVFPCEQK